MSRGLYYVGLDGPRPKILALVKSIAKEFFRAGFTARTLIKC